MLLYLVHLFFGFCIIYVFSYVDEWTVQFVTAHWKEHLSCLCSARIDLTRPTLAVARYSQTIELTYQSMLYTVETLQSHLLQHCHCSLKPMLVLCLVYCTVLLLCAAIAAHTLFEGVGPLILTEHARSFRKLIIGGGSNIEGESLACQLHVRSARKTEKMLLLKVV